MTKKQKLFVKEYLKDLNGTQAAIRAGYSEDTAKEIAHENLTKPHIQEAVAKELEARNKRINIDADGVVQLLEAAAVRYFNGEKKVDETGKQLEEYKYPPNPLAFLKALELLGKHLGMWRDQNGFKGKTINLHAYAMQVSKEIEEKE